MDDPTRKAERSGLSDPPAPASEAVPAPVDVRAELGDDGRSVTISWAAGSPHDVEYKISRLTDSGRWHVVGRTRATSLNDGAPAPGAEIPVYGVVARHGSAVSALARSSAPQKAAAPSTADPPPDALPPGGIPAVRHLAVSAAGALEFDWPTGITEAMVVVRHDRPPRTPDDPAAIAWKITNT